jgi:hypothetical protein
MATFDAGGGGGFCTFSVLPPHPVSIPSAAAGGRRKSHRLVANADLLESELHHLSFASRKS